MLPCRRFADVLADACARQGSMWVATPSSQWTFTTYSLPVSFAYRRTHFRVAARTLAPSPICDQPHRRLQPFRHLHDCPVASGWSRLPEWDLHPLERAAFSRRTREAVVADRDGGGRSGRGKLPLTWRGPGVAPLPVLFDERAALTRSF